MIIYCLKIIFTTVQFWGGRDYHSYSTKSLGCDDGAKLLSEALRLNTTLTTLVFKGGNEVAKSLSEVLIVNTTLTELNLTYCNIGPEGAKSLSDDELMNKNILKRPSDCLEYILIRKCDEIAWHAARGVNKYLHHFVHAFCKKTKVDFKSRNVLWPLVVKSGHLKVLKWVRENGCPWDKDTCSDATGEGHLEVLKWVLL